VQALDSRPGHDSPISQQLSHRVSHLAWIWILGIIGLARFLVAILVAAGQKIPNQAGITECLGASWVLG
jgi:hypothetical protein